MKEEKDDKPIEMPSRGRPRKRDVVYNSSSYEEKNIYLDGCIDSQLKNKMLYGDDVGYGYMTDRGAHMNNNLYSPVDKHDTSNYKLTEDSLKKNLFLKSIPKNLLVGDSRGPPHQTHTSHDDPKPYAQPEYINFISQNEYIKDYQSIFGYPGGIGDVLPFKATGNKDETSDDIFSCDVSSFNDSAFKSYISDYEKTDERADDRRSAGISYIAEESGDANLKASLFEDKSNRMPTEKKSDKPGNDNITTLEEKAEGQSGNSSNAFTFAKSIAADNLNAKDSKLQATKNTKAFGSCEGFYNIRDQENDNEKFVNDFEDKREAKQFSSGNAHMYKEAMEYSQASSKDSRSYEDSRQRQLSPTDNRNYEDPREPRQLYPTSNCNYEGNNQRQLFSKNIRHYEEVTPRLSPPKDKRSYENNKKLYSAMEKDASYLDNQSRFSVQQEKVPQCKPENQLNPYLMDRSMNNNLFNASSTRHISKNGNYASMPKYDLNSQQMHSPTNQHDLAYPSNLYNQYQKQEQNEFNVYINGQNNHKNLENPYHIPRQRLEERYLDSLQAQNYKSQAFNQYKSAGQPYNGTARMQNGTQFPLFRQCGFNRQQIATIPSPGRQTHGFYEAKEFIGRRANEFDEANPYLLQQQDLEDLKEQYNNSWVNRKKRKSNPLLWQYIKSNQEVYPNIIHPSKYSNIDFIHGIDKKDYFDSFKSNVQEKDNPNSVLPLFLSSNKELTEEYKSVVSNFQKRVNELDFNNVTVQQLKILMKEFGLNHTGKKNELIERIKNTLNKIEDRRIQRPGVIAKQSNNESDDYGCYFF